MARKEYGTRNIGRRLVDVIMVLVLAVTAMAATPRPVLAAVDPACDKSSSFLGLPTWYKYLDVGPQDSDPCAIKGPKDANDKFNWQAAIPLVLLAGAEILLRLSALVAIAFVVVGGVKFITSQGEPEGAKNARGTIINALIGLVIAISATALVTFIGGAID